MSENGKMEAEKIDVVNRDMKEALLNNQKSNLKEEMDELEKCLLKRGSTAAVFKLKEKLLGSKKSSPEATAIKDPISGDLITDRKEVLKVTLSYCKSLLDKKKPTDEYIEDYISKTDLHEKRMEKDDENEEFTKDMFEKALAELAKKKSEKYKFILKSGNSYKDALMKLFKSVWTNEEQPESWRKTTTLPVQREKKIREI